MELQGKKIIILAEEMYNEQELWYPYYRLKEAGAEVVLVGSGSSKTYKGKSGLPVEVDTSVEQISSSDFDGVIIPGGFAPDYMRRCPAMIQLVKELFRQDKVVAAICHGGWLLASAEVVSGKKVTSFFAIKDDLVHAGANYVDQEVSVDGNLITSRKPEDLPAFMRTIITALLEKT
jgi:protease I